MVEASPYARRTTRNRVKSARMICKPIWMWYMHALINKKCIRAAVSPPQAEIFPISSCSYAVFLTKTRFSEGFLTEKSQNFLDWGANYEKAPPLFSIWPKQGGLFIRGGLFYRNRSDNGIYLLYRESLVNPTFSDFFSIFPKIFHF